MADDRSTGQDSLPLSVLAEVDRLGDEFEAAWESAQQPRIEDYLGRVGESTRRALLRELLAIELQLRGNLGHQPRHDEYLPRFPAEAQLVHRVFGELTSTGPVQNLRSPELPPEASIDTSRPDSVTETSRNDPDGAESSLAGELLSSPGRELTSLGRFQILGVLGKGAFGKVYRAHDPQLDRQVALKVPRLGEFDQADDERRFLREARSAAQLRHPNIVPVFDAGRIGQTCYIASAFIEGQTLQQALAGGRRFTLAESAALVEKLAAALHYAHSQGIIHRDIKPGNIMLDAAGEPHVMDFGLARRDEGGALRTQEGVRMGTPAYMSPEQAKGQSHLADARSDLWSLGVLLYELLACERPFTGDTVQMVNAVLSKRPNPLRQLDKTIPRDLETICHKCLAKEPDQRYTSCRDLAEELACWRRGETIRARPISWPVRGWRWCRRNPVVAGLTAAVAVALVVGTVVSSMFAIQANLQAARARKSERLAEDRATLAEKQKNRADGEAKRAATEAEHAKAQAKLAEEQRKRADDETKRATTEAENAKTQLLRAQKSEYVTRIGIAQRAIEDGDLGDAESILNGCAWDMRGWEHRYLSTMLHRRVVTLKGHTGPVHCVAISPDGRRIVSGSYVKTLKIWDAATGQEVLTLKGHTQSVECVAFSPDGRRIVSGSNDKTLKVWDANSGQETLTLKGHANSVYGVAFSPDGRRIVSGSTDNTLKVWDAASGQEVLTFKGHTQSVECVAFSPDGQRIVSGSKDNTLKIWAADTGQEVLALNGHTGPVESVAYSPDGRRIVSGSGDKTLKVWDATSGQETLILKGHTHSVDGVAFSPDGRRIVSGSWDAALKVWDATSGEEPLTLKGHAHWVESVAFSPDGRRIVSGGGQDGKPGELKVWDAASGQEVLMLKGHTQSVESVAFSPDGRRIVSGSHDNTLKVWDATSGQETLTLKGHSQAVMSVTFSPDGRWIASGSLDKSLKIWDATSGQETLTLRGHTRRIAPMVGPHPDWVTSVAFSPDGRRIVSGSWDSPLKVWDSANGQEVLTLKGHTDWVFSVAFSDDGQRIVSGSHDNTLKVWDATSGQETLTLKGHRNAVTSVTFSPDGRRIVSGSHDNTLKVWDAGSSANRGNQP